MAAIFQRLSGKLCPRAEPERGSLKRVDVTPVPEGLCPILSLPPEVRACIFKYLLDDADLCFRFSSSLETSTCWVRWPDYKKNLHFLKTCALFEAEALSLVPIRAITMEVDPESDANRDGQSSSNLKTPPRLSGSQPIPVPLCLKNAKHHIRQLNVDAERALPMLLKTDVLEIFPKLSNLHIRQGTVHGGSSNGWRERIDNASVRREYMFASLRKEVVSSDTPQNPCKLLKLLQDERLKPFYPLIVEVDMLPTPRRCGLFDTEVPVFPIFREVAGLRFSYSYPDKQILSMEVDMYCQPMEMAIKSRWTETVSLGDDKHRTNDTNTMDRNKAP